MVVVVTTKGSSCWAGGAPRVPSTSHLLENVILGFSAAGRGRGGMLAQSCSSNRQQQGCSHSSSIFRETSGAAGSAFPYLYMINIFSIDLCRILLPWVTHFSWRASAICRQPVNQRPCALLHAGQASLLCIQRLTPGSFYVGTQQNRRIVAQIMSSLLARAEYSSALPASRGIWGGGR